MKTIFGRILKLVTVSAAMLLITCSGSAIFAIASLLEHSHECCCGDVSGETSDESFKCDKNCCTITDSKENKIVCSVPGASKPYDRNCSHNSFNNIPVDGSKTHYTFIIGNSNAITRKIYLSVSSIRI